MRRLRYRFWLWTHDQLERAWHWVYHHKVEPLAPPPPCMRVDERRYVLLGTCSPSPSDRARGVDHVELWGGTS